MQHQAIRQREAEARRPYEEEQKRLQFAKNIGGLLSMNARDFELTIGSLLTAYGYRNVQHIGKAGDNGADLYAVSPRGERVIVQCKRYAPGQRVSSSAIRDFMRSMTVHTTDRGIFVTPQHLSLSCPPGRYRDRSSAAPVPLCSAHLT